MSKELYILSFKDYELGVFKILTGPKVDNWKNYCDKMINISAEKAIKIAKKNRAFIGFEEIFKQMIDTLKDYGYQEIELETAEYFSNTIIGLFEKSDGDIDDDLYKILNKDVFEKISDHNSTIWNDRG